MKNTRACHEQQHFDVLATWYETPLGQKVAAQVKDQLTQHFSNFFGYHSVQLGLPNMPHWLHTVPISHTTVMQPWPDEQLDLQSQFHRLPFADNSLDFMLLPHTLEHCAHPGALLDEVSRVLIPHGRAVFVGFNLYSLWGVKRYFHCLRSAQWGGRWHSPLSLNALLADHSLATEHVDTFFYRPPLANARSLERLYFLEKLGQLAWPYPGGLYCCVAKKYAMRITPTRQIWRIKDYVIGKVGVQVEAE